MIARVTAGLKWAPEQVPRAKIMHIKEAAMDHTGAGDFASTFKPTVRTKKKVPMNSLTRRVLRE